MSQRKDLVDCIFEVAPTQSITEWALRDEMKNLKDALMAYENDRVRMMATAAGLLPSDELCLSELKKFAKLVADDVASLMREELQKMAGSIAEAADSGEPIGPMVEMCSAAAAYAVLMRYKVEE